MSGFAGADPPRVRAVPAGRAGASGGIDPAAVRGGSCDGIRDAEGPNTTFTGQTLRVPARVVMLGPPYPLISPMSRVRI